MFGFCSLFFSNPITVYRFFQMSQGSFATFSDPLDYIYLCASVGCVVCAALAAGQFNKLLLIFFITVFSCI
jgi:hypothetical protein